MSYKSSIKTNINSLLEFIHIIFQGFSSIIKNSKIINLINNNLKEILSGTYFPSLCNIYVKNLKNIFLIHYGEIIIVRL